MSRSCIPCDYEIIRIDRYYLRPFCPYDRKLTHLIVQAAALLPEILPIAISTGMSITDDIRRSIFDLFVVERKGNIEARCDELKVKPESIVARVLCLKHEQKLYAEAPALRPDLQAVASSMFGKPA